jgi:hypothetical protein
MVAGIGEMLKRGAERKSKGKEEIVVTFCQLTVIFAYVLVQIVAQDCVV